MIQLQKLTADDIQLMISDMKEKQGYSYSTVKKAYDCMRQVLTHATVKEDIIKNPILLVKMPDKRQFPQKEIRFFNREECLRIIEEVGRTYNNGKTIYVYGDAYILMLNTGIRMGEAIGLEKQDWDREKKTLHIRRNVQSVLKRDSKKTDKTPLEERVKRLNVSKYFIQQREAMEKKISTEELIFDFVSHELNK